MRKKFIAVYALMAVLALGSTTLTSCVDDNESASVTAIRDAKAAQLNALANYHNAQAEAEKIKAEAEAAINNAEAAIREAQAQMQQAKADSVSQVMATNIEAAKVLAEKNLVDQQKKLETAKADLIAELDKVEAAEQKRITDLINEADALMSGTPAMGGENIQTLTKNIIDKKADIVKAEYELSDLKLDIQDETNKANATLAAAKDRVEAIKDYSNTTKEEAVAEATKLANEAEALYPTYQEADKEYQLASQTCDQEYIKITGTEFYTKCNNGIINYSYWKYEYADGEDVSFTLDNGTYINRTYYAPSKLVLTDAYDDAVEAAEAAVKADPKDEDAAETLATLKGYKTAYDTYAKVYETYEKAYKDYLVTKFIAQYKAYRNWREKYELANIMNNYANGLTDWEEQKILADQAVVRAEKALADIKGTYEGNSDGLMTAETKEKYTEFLKTELAQMEQELSYKQAQYEEIMKKVQNLIENGTTLPETPEEGGEETPAE